MFFVVFICKISWDLGLKQTQTATRSRWFGPSSSRPPPTVSVQLPSIPPHVSDIQRGTERHVSLFLYSLLPLLLLLFFLIISKTNMCERGGRRRAETQDGAVSGRLNLYHVGETSNWEIHVPQNTDARLVFPSRWMRSYMKGSILRLSCGGTHLHSSSRPRPPSCLQTWDHPL